MSISSPSIDAVLAQMRTLATESAAGATNPIFSPTTNNNNSSNSFAAQLESSINRLAATQNQANTQAESFVAGTSNASLNDVMIDLQKASLAFQTSIQVRNRFVQAYQSVASMPV